MDEITTAVLIANISLCRVRASSSVVSLSRCNIAGRLFDKDGNVKQWWSSVDISKFIERAQCFIDQYSNYTVPEVDMNVIAFSQLLFDSVLSYTCI